MQIISPLTVAVVRIVALLIFALMQIDRWWTLDNMQIVALLIFATMQINGWQ